MLYVTLIIAFAVIGIGIILFGLSASQSQAHKEEQEQIAKRNDDAELLSQLTQKIKEMEKAHVELLRKHQAAAAELDASKQQAAQLQADAALFAEKESKAGQEASKLKEEIAGLKEKIGNKEQGLERASALNAELTKELKQKEEQVQVLERHKGELAEEVKGLHAKLDEEKAKAAAMPVVDPAAVAELKSQLELLRKEAGGKDADLARSRAEADALRKELAQAQAVSAQPKGIPEEEYMKIKDKLEAAEKILRIIHGAG